LEKLERTPITATHKHGEEKENNPLRHFLLFSAIAHEG
jgi:hypothetical protein